MTDIAAVIGLNELSNMDRYLERRRHYGRILREGVEKIDGLHPQKTGEGVNHSYSYFSLVMDLEMFKCTRDLFIETLKAENIDCVVRERSIWFSDSMFSLYWRCSIVFVA